LLLIDDVCSLYGQYRIACRLESTFRLGPSTNFNDNLKSVDIIKKDEEEHLDEIAERGVELLLLGGLCVVFFCTKEIPCKGRS
jgi:hypothetical protein